MDAKRPTQPGRKAHAALARVLALACAMAVVLVAPLARAAAPMCGAEGISVAAPPPVLPIDGSRANAAPPCANDKPGSFFTEVPPAHEAPTAASATTPDRVLPWGHACFACPRSGVLELARAGEAHLRPGYRSSVFRPPRVG